MNHDFVDKFDRDATNDLDQSIPVIGDRIRRLRLQQNRTMAEIATKSRVSKSLISKIENGKVIPSVGALVKIAGALGAPISALIESENNAHAVYTSKEKSHKKTPHGRSDKNICWIWNSNIPRVEHTRHIKINPGNYAHDRSNE